MRKSTKALLAVAIAGAVTIAIPGSAHAAKPNPAPTNPITPSVTVPDGNFYVQSEYGWFAAVGNSSAWPWTHANKNDLVTNNGYAGGRDHVNIYWGYNYTGAYACIGPGTTWWLDIGWTERFTWTRNGDTRGYWEWVWNNAASHRWVYYCGDNTW